MQSGCRTELTTLRDSQGGVFRYPKKARVGDLDATGVLDLCTWNVQGRRINIASNASTLRRHGFGICAIQEVADGLAELRKLLPEFRFYVSRDKSACLMLNKRWASEVRRVDVSNHRYVVLWVASFCIISAYLPTMDSSECSLPYAEAVAKLRKSVADMNRVAKTKLPCFLLGDVQIELEPKDGAGPPESEPQRKARRG